jgi:hypothetical protein
MSYDELENAWRSPRNQPDTAALAAMHGRFLDELESRRRGVKLLLFAIVAALSLLTLRFGVYVFRPMADQPPFEWSREWGALLFLLVPWAGAVFFARRLMRHEREHGYPERNVRESVRALLDENAMSRARLKAVAALHVTLLVLLPLVVWQLRAIGKAGDEIVLPAFVGWPLIAAAILGAMWWHDRAKLRPRRAQLEELLRGYETR